MPNTLKLEKHQLLLLLLTKEEPKEIPKLHQRMLVGTIGIE